MVRDLSCYNGGDCCFIGKIQTCEKVEFIVNQRRVTMVEACENNDERIDSDSDTIEIIGEKCMVVAVLADNPNYEHYLQKLTTSSETIEQRFSDSWGELLIVVQYCKSIVLR